MAMRRIVGMKGGESPPGMLLIRTLFRFDGIPAAQRIPIENASSEFVDPNVNENNDLNLKLASGEAVEETYRFRFAKSKTAAQIQSDLEDAWNDRNDARGGHSSEGAYYGRYWDGTSWG